MPPDKIRELEHEMRLQKPTCGLDQAGQKGLDILEPSTSGCTVPSIGEVLASSTSEGVLK